jgi:formiminoglutamase
MTEDGTTECCRWRSIADLLGDHPNARLAILGAPLNEKSLTPGRCDLAPGVVRQTLKRLSTYDLESGTELGDVRIHDAGDVFCKVRTPEALFAPIRDAVAALTGRHDLTLLLGGNNAVTRPGAHGLGLPLAKIGLITLDAHFDLRDTDCGLTNGNPVRALLEDGLPGANICQIGLAPFANTTRMHAVARTAGIGIFTAGDVKRSGIQAILEEALTRLAGCEAIMVDFDIDVIDRAQLPGAPGARPGGMPADMFFQAARWLGRNAKVRLVDLTEFDPSLDVAEISALTAARWLAEVVTGFGGRPRAQHQN